MKKWYQVVAMVSIALLLIVGCGDDDDDDTEAPPSATSVTADPPSGSRVSTNSIITFTLDKTVKIVSVNGTPATGANTIWTVTGVALGLTEGPVTLVVTWLNSDDSEGSATVSYTVLPPTHKTPLHSGYVGVWLYESLAMNDEEEQPYELYEEERAENAVKRIYPSEGDGKNKWIYEEYGDEPAVVYKETGSMYLIPGLVIASDDGISDTFSDHYLVDEDTIFVLQGEDTSYGQGRIRLRLSRIDKDPDADVKNYLRTR